MTAPGAVLLDQADLASLARASGIALQSYRRAHVSACVARILARHGTPFDLVPCRNATIYFEPPAQRAVHAKPAASLGQGGMLMLGSCEQLLRPGRLGLAAAQPHVYRKDAG